MKQMSYTRFQKLMLYFHISESSKSSIQQKQWWKKLELLNSIIGNPAKKCFLPSMNAAINKMMIQLLGRSALTIKILNKPIGLDSKVLAVCDTCYTYDWELTSQVEGFATSVEQKKPYPL